MHTQSTHISFTKSKRCFFFSYQHCQLIKIHTHIMDSNYGTDYSKSVTQKGQTKETIVPWHILRYIFSALHSFIFEIILALGYCPGDF